MKNKTKLKANNFIWIFLAAVLFVLRYVTFLTVDRLLLGSTKMSFAQKLEYCSKPIIENLETCTNVGFYNNLFWIIFVILIIIQLFVIYKKYLSK